MEGVTLTEVTLDVERSAVVIKDLRIEDYTFYNYLVALDEEKRVEFVKRALQVGFDVLQAMVTTARVDYVRGEFDRMQREFESDFDEIFSEKGIMKSSMERFLGQDGELRKTLDAHFGERGSVIYKILNPDDETTPLGKFKKQLQQELDVNRDGTAFQKLKSSMEEGFKNILIELRSQEAVAEEHDKGTAKGGEFEDYVFAMLDYIARDFEDTVEFVGDDSGPLGKVGDVLIHVNPRDTRSIGRRIVVEAKNRTPTMTGKNSYLNELDKAKENRVAHYAIGAVHESKAPSSCGCFRRYDGEKIVCSVPEDGDPLALEMAYKIARSELVASSLREEVKLDLSQLKTKIGEIERQLDAVKTIKTNMKSAVTSIGKADDGLKEMEASIREIAGEILLMIKTGSGP